MDKKQLNKSTLLLDQWLGKNGLAGIDPYTLADKLYRTKTYKHFGSNRIIKHGFYQLQLLCPEVLNSILKPKSEINAKGLGLLAMGYLNLFEVKKDEKYLKKATEILDWLIDNSNSDYKGYSWGYPFDWHADIFIPKSTPSSVVTVTVGYAFLKAWQLTQSDKYRSVSLGISEFLISDLNKSFESDEAICFSYTPLDHKHVINANLFIGDFLAKTVNYCSANQKYMKIAEKINNYTVQNQNSDGSFYYYGPQQEETAQLSKVLKMIDHYHTGFVLRTLQSLHLQLYNNHDSKYVDRGLDYYLTYLFDGFIPKFIPTKIYPIDIHSVSEALLVLNQFRNKPLANEKLENFLPWAIKNFQDKSGYFYYNYYQFKRGKIAYLRWGQAWMFFALSEIMKKENL